MSIIEYFTVDADAFDEAESRDLALHYRLERARHVRAERKLTLIVWLITLFFASFLMDAPHLIEAVIK